MNGTNYNAFEIEKVPYMGIQECKKCSKRETEIIENRMEADGETIICSITLQCEKLPICLEIKKRLLAKMRGYVIYGDDPKTPNGLLKSEWEK